MNLYPDGSAGVAAHSDNEAGLVAGMDIYSFTLLRKNSDARPFTIYRPNGEKLQDIVLENGDLLIMSGDMQKEFKHGVEAVRKPKQYGPRINLTVRAFRL